MTPLDSRLRLTLFIAGLLLGSRVYMDTPATVTAADEGETLETAVRRNVAALLEHEHGAVVANPETDVVWIDPPPGNVGVFDTMDRQTFALLATPAGGKARDLYRMEARISPYGRVFDPRWIVNLTHTTGADDSSIATSGTRVATAVRWGGVVIGIDVRDLAGEDPERAGIADWSRTRLLGNAVTNLEQTGSTVGIDLDHYIIEGGGPTDVTLSFDGDALQLIDADAGAAMARIDLAAHTGDGDLKFTYLPPETKMKYDFLNWLADRGRGLADRGLAPAWAGHSIELMKEVYFKAKVVQAEIEEVAAPEPIVVEAAEVVEEAAELARFQAEESKLPWPPAPLKPLLENRAKGEGLWEPIGPELVQHNPNAPTPMYKTWLRPEPEYTRKRIYVAVWDPAQVSLLMRAGTSNPEPQTGHRGDGRISRDPAHLGRVIGGFNGGFQTAHIWYGMMVDKKVLLRPREYGATAGSWADGRTAFGTWRPFARIPKDLTHYRQNLPPLVEDGQFNPYRRRTWGWHRKVAGAIEGRTIRSAVCYTKDQYVMYFYSEFSNARTLADTLIHIGCVYAIHLDMNRGHTGFEHYKRLAEGEAAASEEALKEVVGLRFQGSTLHPTNMHMKAPVRYLGVDYRDFFYLRLRHVVPGADLPALRAGDPAPEEGEWEIKSLPHNGEFPPRLATTRIRPRVGPGQLTVMQLDPRALSAAMLPASQGDQAPEVDRKTLVATIPILTTPQGELRTVTLGDVSIMGAPLEAAPAGAMPRAIVWGIDPNGFVMVVDVENAELKDAADVLAGRGVKNGIWTVPLDDGPTDIRIYQATQNEAGEDALIELPLGAIEGKVVTQVTSDSMRVMIHAEAREPRIVRLFPDMKPREPRRKPGRK